MITSALGIGYGDVYPRTAAGKVLLIALFAMILIFIPRNVVSKQRAEAQAIQLYQLWKSENSTRDRSRLQNSTHKRHLVLTGYCSYRDVFSTLVYQWRDDFVGDDFICGRSGGM